MKVSTLRGYPGPFALLSLVALRGGTYQTPTYLPTCPLLVVVNLPVNPRRRLGVIVLAVLLVVGVAQRVELRAMETVEETI